MTPVALSRWLGSKRWLTAKHPRLLPMPRRNGVAFDVTAGGCSVPLWYLAQGCRVVIGDTNARLIGCLRNLQQDADNVIAILASLAAMFATEPDRKAFFVATRDMMNTEAPEDPFCSARFLFVLRAGFNGLYRENSKGACNVPFGEPSRGKDMVRAEELRAIGTLLQRAVIRLGDFETTSAGAGKHDALFADPPYVAPGAFVSYGKGGFTLADRLRFGAWLRDLDRRGVRWTVTDTRSDHALSTFGLWSVDEVSVRRSVSATTKGRGKASEILVRNWQSPEARAA